MNSLFRNLFVHPLGRTLYSAGAAWKDVSKNAFYDKYKDKVDRVQGSSFNAHMKTDTVRKVVHASHASNGPHQRNETSPPDLNKLMKLDLIQSKSSDDIAKIWVEYLKTKDCVSTTIPSPTYLQLHTKSLYCPMFVYPLPRNDGYEMWFAQFSGQRCYFTALINYQMFQENAPISYTITHYTEFLDYKGIVLVHGEVDTNVLSTLEAQNLTNQMYLYYASNKPDLYALVREFNYNPQQFDYKLIIEQLHNHQL